MARHCVQLSKKSSNYFWLEMTPKWTKSNLLVFLRSFSSIKYQNRLYHLEPLKNTMLPKKVIYKLFVWGTGEQGTSEGSEGSD
jgi:hypothetical protein